MTDTTSRASSSRSRALSTVVLGTMLFVVIGGIVRRAVALMFQREAAASARSLVTVRLSGAMLGENCCPDSFRSVSARSGSFAARLGLMEDLAGARVDFCRDFVGRGVRRWRSRLPKGRRGGESELKKGDHFAAFKQPALLHTGTARVLRMLKSSHASCFASLIVCRC
jgi:hypothetical protein